MLTLYENIIRICKQRGISGSRMCVDTDISKSTLTSLKTGRTRTISAENLQKISKYLGVSVDDLLNGDTKNAPTEKGCTMHNSVQYVRKLAKERKVPISQLERDLGFSNGYLNPKKMEKLPYDRAVAIADYLNVSVESILVGIGDTKNAPTENGCALHDSVQIVFYDKFVDLCEARGVSPSRAAFEAGISKSLVTKWRTNGVKDPSPDVLRKLSKYFGITVAELMGEQKNAPTESGKREINDDDIKFALFGGSEEITDDMYDEVKSFAEFVKNREEQKKHK